MQTTQRQTTNASQTGTTPLGQYIIPGTGLFPEGLVYDPQTNSLFTTSMQQGTIFKTTLDQQQFQILSPAGANGCTSVLGLRMDHERRRLFASAGNTGMGYVFHADTGEFLGKFSNGLAPQERGTMGPHATSPTLINDVAVVNGDAYFTDSYYPALFRLPKEAIAHYSGGTGTLEPWLNFEGTVLKYQKGAGLADGLNLNGIVASEDGQYLLTVQTNTGKMFRITIATKEIIEIDLAGETIFGGDGMFLWGNTLLVIHMTDALPMTKVTLSNDFSQGQIVAQLPVPGVKSPTNAAVVNGRLLVVNSQIDVLFFGASQHLVEKLPYTIDSFPIP